jgi:hypothetical protein
VLSVAEVSALVVAPDAMSDALLGSIGCARITLHAERNVWCLVDLEDYGWASAHRWNCGWHTKTKWKIYAKRNVGVARSTVYLHREILIRATGEADAAFLAAHHAHHLNGQSLDCRRTNLAWATKSVNAAITNRRAACPSLESIVARLLAERRDDVVPF